MASRHDFEIQRVERVLKNSIARVESETPTALDALKAATDAALDESLDLARVSRTASGTMRAVKPMPFEEQSEITRKFTALKSSPPPKPAQP